MPTLSRRRYPERQDRWHSIMETFTSVRSPSASVVLTMTTLLRGFDVLDELGQHPQWSVTTSPRGAIQAAKAGCRRLRSAYHSVGAIVRGGVRRIIWATEAVVVNAAVEMTPSNAKVPCVDARHATSGDAVEVVSAETSDSTDAQATHMTATNVTHTGTDVTSAKAAHTATKVSSASASTAAPGLCARGKKAAGKHCACQNHHHSSSHDILH
jgi:hypothetical protein